MTPSRKSGKSQPTAGRAPRWTVMVFMVAQNVDGESAALDNEAARDIAEMEAALLSPSPHLNVFYQVHGADTQERCHVGQPRVAVPPAQSDVTNGVALSAFITWALTEANHQPEDYSLLVLWGHAYRFGIGHSRTAHGIDAIDFHELSSVLRKCRDGFGPRDDSHRTPRLDVLGFDACDLSTVEIAFQLREFADFLLASQIGVPLPGWPYNKILGRLAEPKGRLMGPAELGSYAVRRYCQSYAATKRSVALTLLDLRRADELFGKTEWLARELAISVDGDDDELENISELFRRSQTAPGKPFVDVADLCLNLMLHAGSDEVKQAARRLGNFLVSPVSASPDDDDAVSTHPFVLENGRNAVTTARLQGVSLYAPHVALETHDWLSACTWYEKLVIAEKTLWNEFVRALAQPSGL